MQITRRDSLVGASAAAVVAGVPMAALGTQTDPLALLVRKAAAYEEWLNSIGGTVSDDEFNALCALHDEMECEIRDTPSTSIEAIAGKVRIAWQNSATGIAMEHNGPSEDFAPLDPVRLIWSALQDLERLAGEARS